MGLGRAPKSRSSAGPSRFVTYINDSAIAPGHGARMPRFFLHICNRIGFAADEEGADLASLDAAVEQAKEGIRSILSDEAKKGRLDLNGRIEIADETGAVRRTIPFSEAFDIVLPAGRAYPKE